MPMLQCSIEGTSIPADDPWDWTVDQVVFVLTDTSSPLMIANPSLSLPGLAMLASILQEHDVNGLALLTLVKDESLRVEFGIKSMSQRASILHLVRLLQAQSQKYEEHFNNSGRVSSFGATSRFASPYVVSPQQYVLGAASRVATLARSPRSIGDLLKKVPGIKTSQGSSPDRDYEQLDSVLAEASDLISAPKPEQRSSRSPQISRGSPVLKIDSNSVGCSNSRVSEPQVDLNTISHETLPASPLMRVDVIHHEQSKRQGETIIIDEQGRKRRRLVLGQSEGTKSADLQEALNIQGTNHSGSPDHLMVDFEAASPAKVLPFLLGNGILTCSDGLPSNIPTQPPKSTGHVPELEAGNILIDEQGRKRLRPILLPGPDQNSEVATMRSEEDKKHRMDGRKAKRAAKELYAGLEPMSVDKLFYGDVGLEKKLEKNWSLDKSAHQDLNDRPGSFCIQSGDTFSNGQRSYVNARIKYFLRSPGRLLGCDGRECVGIIPYSDRFGRKNHPLSITIFSKSREGVTVSRSNRSKWIRARNRPDSADPNNISFTVAYPTLTQDEPDDSDWKALEKWNYMEGQDEILPRYGESGSEGEYELDTWREMEQERGTIPRPLGRSVARKLTSEKVGETIDTVLKQLIYNWKLKRLPQLQSRAWRFWAKSRRNNDANSQIVVFTNKVQELEDRICIQRREITAEVWSRPEDIVKQCGVMQPSVFDREDHKWRIALLRSTKMPPRPSPTPRNPKVAHITLPSEEGRVDEEDLESDLEAIESSDGDSLNDFIVEDINEAEEIDDVLGVIDADVELESDHSPSEAREMSDFFKPAAKGDHHGTSSEDISGSDSLIGSESDDDKALQHLEPGSLTHQREDGSQNRFVKPSSNFIDLTQQSDPSEPLHSPVKTEPSYDIVTPPLFESENDSELFMCSRDKNKKPRVFRKPTVALETTNIIDLDADSSDPESPSARKALPELTDVDDISEMDPHELVRRKDRHRLLVWAIAHALPTDREASFQYLQNRSVSQSYTEVMMALQELCRRNHRIRGMDRELSESIMKIAAWRVCWTIPVKVDISGLKMHHLTSTIEDEEGYGPFHEFLLKCMKHYVKRVQDPGKRSTPSEPRDNVSRNDTDEVSHKSPFRKRKHRIQESQVTLDKRQAARDRLRGDEERRHREATRREELKSRFEGMEKEGVESLGVVLNPGKLDDQEFVYLSPRFGNGVRLRPHQKEGLQFLWREITADHDDLQGCLLAQTMGLGKTMQVIALMVALSETSRSRDPKIRQQVPPTLRESRTLVLCPPALVENWWDEFILWVPQPSSETIGEVRKVSKTLVMSERLDQIYAWAKEGGVLLIGYDAFKGLVNNKPRLARMTLIKKAPLGEIEHAKIKEALIGSANLVVGDEAHFFKTMSTGINSAMNQIRTRSRIALTGSPLNNNLEEYYTLIDWIAPNYLGTRVEFKATYEEPIREGLYQDSTSSQKRTSLKKLKALELEIGPKVNRVSASVLQTDLKGKLDFVIVVSLTELQKLAYNIYVTWMKMASSEDEPRYATLWTWLGVLQLLCNHPKCYWDKLHESKPQEKNKRKFQKQELPASEEDPSTLDEPVSQVAVPQIVQESMSIFNRLDQPLDALCLSHKMQLLMSILHFAEAAQDKVLVFSHRIATLDYIGCQLAKSSKAYVRIDGTLETNKRQQISKDFNTNNVNVCLISTRAGGTGLNFYGANRVVILDEGFNPTWEQQAIGRAYRIGQQKVVYVYRLQAAGTFEKSIQNQGLFKEQLATRVVDKKNPTRSASKGAGAYLFPPQHVEQQDLSKFLGNDPMVLDKLLADSDNHILSITPSEIFHIEDNEALTAEEKIEAEQMQKDEQMRRRDPIRYNAMIEMRKAQISDGVPQATHIPNSAELWQIMTRSDQSTGTHDKTADTKWPCRPYVNPLLLGLSSPDTVLSSIAPALDAGTSMVPPSSTTIVHRSSPTSPPALHEEAIRNVSNLISEPQSHPSSAGPSAPDALQPTLTPKGTDKQLLDRQLTIPNMSLTVSEAGDVEVLDALNEEITDLFRYGGAPLDEASNDKGANSTISQIAAQHDFYNIMTNKGNQDPRAALPDAARKLYAQELSHIISQRSVDESEHQQFIKSIKTLLKRNEVRPKHLVKIMMQKHHHFAKDPSIAGRTGIVEHSPTRDTSSKFTPTDGKSRRNHHRNRPLRGMLSHTASPISVETSPESSDSAAIARAAQKSLDHIAPIGAPRGERNDQKRKAGFETSGPKENPDPKVNPEHLKHGPRNDDIHRSKKMKGATTVRPNFKNPKGHTERQFQDLLHKETNRSYE